MNLSCNVQGIELIVDFSINEFADFNFSTNGYYNTIDGTSAGYENKKSIYSWNASLNSNFNLTKTTLLQVNASYLSKRLTLQGQRSPKFIMNLGIRQDVLKNRGGIIFTVSDIFNSAQDGTVLDTQWLYQEVVKERDSRIYYLGFIYHFGKAQQQKEIEFDDSF